MAEEKYNAMVEILEKNVYSQIWEEIEEKGYVTSATISECVSGLMREFESKVGEDAFKGDEIFTRRFKEIFTNNVKDWVAENEEIVAAKAETETGDIDVLYGFDMERIEETAEEEGAYLSLQEINW